MDKDSGYLAEYNCSPSSANSHRQTIYQGAPASENDMAGMIVIAKVLPLDGQVTIEVQGTNLSYLASDDHPSVRLHACMQ